MTRSELKRLHNKFKAEQETSYKRTSTIFQSQASSLGVNSGLKKSTAKILNGLILSANIEKYATEGEEKVHVNQCVNLSMSKEDPIVREIRHYHMGSIKQMTAILKNKA